LNLDNQQEISNKRQGNTAKSSLKPWKKAITFYVDRCSPIRTSSYGPAVVPSFGTE